MSSDNKYLPSSHTNKTVSSPSQKRHRVADVVLQPRGESHSHSGSGTKKRRREQIVKRKGIPQTTSFNDRMHPRNLYKDNPPDFMKLKDEFPEFAPYVIQDGKDSSKGHIDWSNREAVKCLTRILLRKDFGIDYWDIPAQNLVPPVPSRLNYILWIEDLINSYTTFVTSMSQNEKMTDQPICGIDIGTGASCIYPLLGTTLRQWNFIGTECDQTSVDNVHRIVGENGLANQIQIVKVNQNEFLTPILSKDVDRKPFDFVMCNPPFFDEEIYASANPKTDYGGSSSETTYPGGELMFTKCIFEESRKYPYSVRWYTTMVGKKETLEAVEKLLKQNSVEAVRTTKFFQGKTIRWGIAWSYYPASWFFPCPDVDIPIETTWAQAAVASTFFITNCKSFENLHRRHEEAMKSLGQTFLFHIPESAATHSDEYANFEWYGIGAEPGTDSITIEDLGKPEKSPPNTFSFLIHAQKQDSQETTGDNVTFEVSVSCLNSTGLGRKSFIKFRDQYRADMQRTNRKWRRMVKHS